MKQHIIPRAVIALGGNALGNTPEEQKAKVKGAVKHLIELIKTGNEIIISHGNGPQVGMINLAFEEASQTNDKIVRFNLPECIAMSQGYIGYHLQNALQAEIYKQKKNWFVASVVTQIEVDKDDEAFKNPSLVMKKDAKRGYRKVFPSPKPIRIVEKESVVSMLDNEFIVVTCGGRDTGNKKRKW